MHAPTARFDNYNYEMYKAEPFSVCAVIFNDKGEVLSVSRKKDHNDLGLPGGKIDPGESCEDALVRELEEETGLKAQLYTVIYQRKAGPEGKPSRCFLVTRWDGMPENREGAVVGWVPPTRLLEENCSFRDYNRALFEHMKLL